MKQIENKTNISLPIALWACYDEYDYDDRENVISTTSLLNPIRMTLLQRIHKGQDKIIDVSDLIGSRLGSSIHDSFEKVLTNETYVKETLKAMGYEPEATNKLSINSPGKLEMWIEQRTEKEINNWIISGKYDMVINQQIMDIKSTSVWTYMFGSNDEKYVQQMSIYKWLNQDKIKKDVGIIHFIFTDWSKQKSYQDKNYPQQRVLSKEYKLMSLEETEKFIKDKLSKINKALEIHQSTGELPLCTSEELWQEPDKWKYYKKKTANRATKVYDTEEEAYQRLADEGQGEVRYFQGGVKRCNYCSVKDFCSQYAQMKNQGLIVT